MVITQYELFKSAVKRMFPVLQDGALQPSSREPTTATKNLSYDEHISGTNYYHIY
jgi:hypothetical protein